MRLIEMEEIGDFPAEVERSRMLQCFKWAIGGGATESRRNVIAERLLGLPGGPQA